jgi:metal-sulfur cluster biosynthetic enzyme
MTIISTTGSGERVKPGWLVEVRAKATADELRLWAALEEVEDPEMPVSVVDMGLIYGLRFENGRAHLHLTFTAMGCPCMEFIISDIRERLLQEDGVTAVTMEIVWDPPWTRQRLTPKGMEKLRAWGIAA